MYKSKTRKLAEDALRAAHETGNAETITKALEAYNKLVEREDRIKGRRRRAKEKKRAKQSPETPTAETENDWLNEEFDFEPPPPAVLTPLLPPEIAREVIDPPPTTETINQPYGTGPFNEVTETRVLDCMSFPSLGGGYGGRPGCGDNGIPWNPWSAAEPCVAAHSFSGGQWDELRERDERSAEEIAWVERSRKLYGR